MRGSHPVRRPRGRTTPRALALTGALLFALAPTPARAATPPWAKPAGTADGPGDVALAIGLTSAASAATGLWLRSRHRRDTSDAEAHRHEAHRHEGGAP